MKENKIVLFANIKGGVGKTTLCSMFGTYCVENKIGVAVVDADIQQSLVRQRSREKASDNEAQEPWRLFSLDTTSLDGVNNMMENLQEVPGWVLVDCPGNLNDEAMKIVLEKADMIIVPISYEDVVIDATGIFIKVLREVSNAPVMFVPNRINNSEGTKVEKEHRLDTMEILGQIGLVGPSVKQCVAVKRFSTLYGLDSAQEKAVKPAFEKIIKKVKQL